MNETLEQLRAHYAESLSRPDRAIDEPRYVVDLEQTWGRLDERGTLWTYDDVRSHEDALCVATEENTLVNPYEVAEGHAYMEMTERDVIAHERSAYTNSDDLVDLLMEQDDLPW